MKRYAELMGNYKKQGIKNLCDNKMAIEYSSDVLIGLQLHGAGEKGFDATKEKSKTPREVELVILKNRNGATGKKIGYNYFPMFNYFEETGEIQEDDDKELTIGKKKTVLMMQGMTKIK